jgi:hypothetical protein
MDPLQLGSVFNSCCSTHSDLTKLCTACLLDHLTVDTPLYETQPLVTLDLTRKVEP